MMRALVLRAPGINCDRETAYACQLVGFATEQVHINELLQAPERLLDYAFLVLAGGFSYGDDLGAGTLLARNLSQHLGPQMRQFIAEGRPVLGICNGFQVLVRAGLLPEQNMRATLTDNASAQFECRWITLAPQPSTCIFTKGIERLLELPVAHGEGQFVLADDNGQLQASGQVPLVYTAGNATASQSVVYPDNPNGSPGNIAGVCNARGNVFGLMPHPERYIHARQHPLRRPLGTGNLPDGLLIFKNAYQYAHTLLGTRASREVELEKSRLVPSTTQPPALENAAPSPVSAAYASSGVNIAVADSAKRLMHEAVRATQGPEVLAGMGAFAGMFRPRSLQHMQSPVLVASTDGVGTKTLVAAQAKRFDTIGYDLVNHSVNDLLTQGAQPLFFMDYLAMGKLDAVQAATIVQSVAAACREVGCALLGGETAEMPDVYQSGGFDLAGTIVGVVEQEEAITGATIHPGDEVLGLPSSGLHTNGYSLARRVFAPYAWDTVFPELGEPLVDVLLRSHRCYLHEINQLRAYLADRGRFIKGIAHITGGGFAGNISRILPTGMQVVIETNTWSVPPIFTLLARLGNVAREELYNTLNMGMGMVIVLSPKAALEARCILPQLLTIGYVTEGKGVVIR